VKKIYILFVLITIFSSAFAQTPADKSISKSTNRVPVTIPKFDSEPAIDGKLDDEIWKKAAIFKDFVQIRPGDGIAPSKETIAYAGYDEKNLYFAFMCFDEPDKIRATVAKRDNVGGEDNVRITLDTFNDQRRAYFIQLNPFGIQGDGVLTDSQQQGGGGPDLSVDWVMESKGVILENGWSVEVKVPFKSLRYQSGKGKIWGFNVSRNISRLNDELDSWSPIKREIPSIRQIGKITGLEDIKVDRTLEIVPSVTLSESGERVAKILPAVGSRIVNNPVKKDIGVSIKYQITPNVTLDAAINPDFAEVEADAPVVKANERFPIFFPEKRPFFLEGNDYFRTPLQVVNTRNIADPDVALKLTGKIGRNTFGFFSAVDRFPNTKTKAYIGVARVRHDIGANSNIGLIATTYHFGGRRHNNLFGVDGKFQTGEKSNFNFQVVGTNSNRKFYNPNIDDLEYRTGNGVAYNVNYDYTGKNRGYTFGINGRSKDYRADVGFTRRTNTHAISGGFRVGTEPKPTKTLIGFSSRTFFNVSIDEAGRLQQARTSFNTEWNFQKELQINTGTDFEISKIYEDEFGAKRNATQEGIFVGKNFRKANQFTTDAEIEKTFSKQLSINAGFGVTTNEFDFDFGASDRYPRVSPFALSPNSINVDDKLDPGKGFKFSYGIGVDLQPIDAWSMELSYDREKLRRNDNKLTAFDSNIYSFRSTYQFTRFTFVRTRIDYETVEGSINSQLLFGWSPNPGTAFYAGYNDSSNYRGFNLFANNFDQGFRRDGRIFFIRMSYLFRRSF
jgi:hypothetical protein